MSIIASVTTTGRRIGRIVPTLESVLRCRPDHLVLWCSRDGTAVAPGVQPRDIPRELASMRVDVRWCENYGPATKLIPAMLACPGDVVVTFDDDHLYPPQWLDGLVVASQEHPGTILAYRCRLASPDPYRKWPLVKRRWFGPDRRLVPTGVHGVLYPPGCLDTQAFDLDLLRELSLPNDDLWFAATRKAPCVAVPAAGKIANRRLSGPRLARRNLHGRNDVIIQALARRFGLRCPWR